MDSTVMKAMFTQLPDIHHLGRTITNCQGKLCVTGVRSVPRKCFGPRGVCTSRFHGFYGGYAGVRCS
jgi:hypothetical protein